jgi:hypothetical protein
MKKFSIEVITKKPKKIYGLLSHEGQITIGDFKETFAMPLNSWKIEQYQQQWKEGLARIKTHDYSCLVSVVQNLNANPLVELWALYKEGNTVFFHNELLNNLIVEELKLPLNLSDFNLKTCYELVNEPREITTPEGDKISAWSVNVDEI